MKLLLLVCDLLIAIAYGIVCYILYPAQWNIIFTLILFFVSFRVLALSAHELFVVGNLLLLIPLRYYRVAVLMVTYLLYAALYILLMRKEQKQQALTEENTRLQIEMQQARSYRQLQARYEHQIAINTRLQERQRIAQEIHDMLGHSVTASVLQLEAAKTLLRKQPDKAEQMMTTAADALREGIDRIRQTVHQVRAEAPALNQQELAVMIERFRRNSGIQTLYEQTGDVSELPQDVWEALQSNVAEALSNVVRHAGATEVTVRLQALPGIVRLEVKDNGVGAKEIKEGMGLSGMRERTTRLGGTLMLQGDKGMKIITLLPRKEMQT